MLKRLRRAHPVGYCLLTEVVFLAVLMVVPVLFFIFCQDRIVETMATSGMKE